MIGRRTEDQVPYDPTAIRNVALVGHHGAGKTTLAEALLAATGSIARRGSPAKAPSLPTPRKSSACATTIWATCW